MLIYLKYNQKHERKLIIYVSDILIKIFFFLEIKIVILYIYKSNKRSAFNSKIPL